MAWRIGVDIGGTFADFVALHVPTGTLRTLKVLTTPAVPGDDVADGLARLAEGGVDLRAVERFVHGTTVGVNTLLQRRGARLALFATEGFTDILELARLRMPETYGLFCTRPDPLVPRERVFAVAERMSAEGRTLRAPDTGSVERAVAAAREAAVEGIVVSFLHAWRNPAHEHAVLAMIAHLAPDLFVFAGSDVWPAIREYERTTTAVINGYVHPRVSRYLERVESRIAEAGVVAPLLLTTSAGGTMTASHGRQACVDMLLSGTASGVVGAGIVARAASEPNVLTLDVGGTSADIALLRDGAPAFGVGQEIGAFPLAVPTVAVNSVGRGGGSVAWIDDHGVLQVGPESMGSDPGPACFARGGGRFTVTDAALLCGVLGHGDLGFGAIVPDRALAAEAARPLAERLGLALDSLSEGVLQVAVSGMLIEIEKLLARSGVHASELTLMPFGGAGPMLAMMVAEAAGMRRVVVPAAPGTLCALGALAADLRRDAVRTILAPLTSQGWAAVQDGLRAVAAEAGAALAAMADASDAATTFSADLRYRGQSHELTVTVAREAWTEPDPSRLVSAFHDAHLTTFGHADEGADVEVLAVRATARLDAPPIVLAARPHAEGEAAPDAVVPVRVGGRACEAALYRRESLAPGMRIGGPAVVTQADTTLLVLPGWSGMMDRHGNLRLEQR